ncbi:hypothetical protein [Odoribacter sp. Z80]|uniref:hypothetical protein n=1 Tax=Odoribacter sp. Z80 TaxID=2304575 RepID=UPI00137ADCD6|nr:hypothetical protein [Odoribacter sp. Z80]
MRIILLYIQRFDQVSVFFRDNKQHLSATLWGAGPGAVAPPAARRKRTEKQDGVDQ